MAARRLFAVPCGQKSKRVFTERRRHHRFSLVETGSEVFFSEASPKARSCKLVNLSQGGMCFESGQALERGSIHDCEIQLRDVLDDLISVTARIHWCEPVAAAGWRLGAEFLGSNRAYLGPERDD